MVLIIYDMLLGLVRMVYEMDNNLTSTDIAQDDNSREKIKSLFKYIQELNKLKRKTVLNVKDYAWCLWIKNLPDDAENIKLFYQDRLEDDEINGEDNFLLSVHKPEFTACPTPDKILYEWLEKGWDDFHQDIKHKEEIVKKNIKQNTKQKSEETEEVIIKFCDSPERHKKFNEWSSCRDIWVKNQFRIEATRKIFTDLYSAYYELKRDEETKEIVVGNGIFCDAHNSAIMHPILTQRVKLDYNADKNTVHIISTSADKELYTDVLQNIDGLNLKDINELRQELVDGDYHPLDRNDTPIFLTRLIRQLSSDSFFSMAGIPDGWEKNSRFLLYMEPCFIIRKKQDGTLKALERIDEAIEAGGEIPRTLLDLVSGGKIEVPEDSRDFSVDEQLAMVGGESVDVLLSKEANREQLEIAQRIENYNAVLVQGPPGTGKTHTIANLLGHFIAQGKSVLVTSYTSKALSVLKDKIAPGLQNLCVALLNDSNKDMEESVDGITDYMARNTSSNLKREIDSLAEERKSVIDKLAEVRKKIFHIMQQETASIVYNGEGFTPSEVAQFVADNAERLDYIPGSIRQGAALPLSYDELIDLYRSNGIISEEDISELECELPSLEELPSYNDFASICQQIEALQNNIKAINNSDEFKVQVQDNNEVIEFDVHGKTFQIDFPDEEEVKSLQEYCGHYEQIDEWKRVVVADGKNGGGYRERWIKLAKQIEVTNKLFADLSTKALGVDIEFANGIFMQDLLPSLHKVKDMYEKNGGLPFMFGIFYADCKKDLRQVRVNGKIPDSAESCELAIMKIEFLTAQSILSNYWKELMVPYGVPEFDLLGTAPVRIATQFVEPIEYYLDWHEVEYKKLYDKLNKIGFVEDIICGVTKLDSEQAAIAKILDAVQNAIPLYCAACQDILNLVKYRAKIVKLSDLLTKGNRINSEILQVLNSAVMSLDAELYRSAYGKLGDIYDKYAIQYRRNEYLNRLTPYAYEWAEAIRRHSGVHGLSMVPDGIEDAWKWKQFSMILDDITSASLSEYQSESVQLSKKYRSITAAYAEKCGWYHLLKRTETDLDLKQALQGWKQLVKRIGKGTGKRAPMYKAEARKKMVHCQKAVPAWIMPIGKAMESMNPAENKFDVVIVDEASQADISSLAILYMGKKLIIVGDDKQVSPMAVGVDVDKMNNLREMCLSEDIPNHLLYDATSSIYDIALTTYQPLMLKEHFRCVPDIIGYCNNLSYDGKILPLRAADDSNILPAVVNYRVDGKREGNVKINYREAEEIVALMQACIEQPEYAGKTFGVISLLGVEQAKAIASLLYQKLSPKDIEERQILCGDSANFQGDERDIVFLSMVDSAEDGTIALRGFGSNDSYRKRYNVAVSRARDQLWVVNSLDSATNLKEGDIRKGLLEYAKNPHSVDIVKKGVEQKADSPFEVSVAMELKNRGYHIVQQWKVGAYRIDMVAVYGDKKIAIECDGERWHSSDEQIRSDMERQAVLERIGWRFIRIRGSEYYRQPDKTIHRVVSELEQYGIIPEDVIKESVEAVDSSTELLERVKCRAAAILQLESEDEQIVLDGANVY